MTPLRFGIIGTGRMATRMLATMRRNPDIRVLAVGSSMPDRASAFGEAFGLPMSGSADEIAGHPGLDAIYLASHNADHARLSLAALAAGKSVLCEKPAALSPDEANRLAVGARASGRTFMEAISTPFLPAFRRAVDLASGGTLGKATLFKADFGFPATPTSHPALHANPGGGVLLDRAVYPLVLALAALGPVTGVRAFVSRDPSGIDVEAALLLTHGTGGCSQIAVSFRSRTANAATIGCEGGSVTLAAPITAPERIEVMRSRPPAHRVDRWPADGWRERVKALPTLRRLAARVLPRHEVHSYGADPYAAELAHFVELVTQGKAESPVVPLDTTLAVQAVIAAARRDAGALA